MNGHGDNDTPKARYRMVRLDDVQWNEAHWGVWDDQEEKYVAGALTREAALWILRHWQLPDSHLPENLTGEAQFYGFESVECSECGGDDTEYECWVSTKYGTLGDISGEIKTMYCQKCEESFRPEW